MAAPTQMTQQQMFELNARLRAQLLATAPPMRKNIGTFTGGTAGSTTRVKLFNVGLTTRVLIDVAFSVDIGTATGTLSPKAPFNLINRLRLTDYDGTDRVNLSGYQLWVLNSIRSGQPAGYNNGSQTTVATNSPDVTALTAGTSTFRFQLEIPLAFDPKSDLRGALLTHTSVGESWLTIDWNTLLVGNGNDDALFNGAATTTVVLTTGTTIDVQVAQEYLLPQTVGGTVPLPTLDLMTVYELNGVLRTTDNIAAGSEKLINYPNVRSVIGCYANFIVNGAMAPAYTNLLRWRLIANGNNVLREYSPTEKLFDQRLDLRTHSDLRPGTFWELHRSKPIETAAYGNVQLGITPTGTITGTTNIETCFESFYTKGSMLPGMTQAS